MAFALLAVTFAVLAAVAPESLGLPLIIGNIFITLFAVFALRGIYFALLEETRTPRHITGTSVGMISFIGFTPDIFFAAIAGRILDAAPGVEGYSRMFMLLVVIALVGMAIVAWLTHLHAK